MKPLLTSLALGLIAPAALASTFDASGTSGLWSNASVWTPAGTPGASDDISITGTVSSDIGVDNAYSVTNFTSTTDGTINFNQASGAASVTVTKNLLLATNAGVVHFGPDVALNVTGTTTVRNQALLRIDGTSTLTGNILLGSGQNSYGILGLGNGDFSATIGSGVGQIQFGAAGGGFAAFGANRTVTLNSGGALSSFTGPLVLGHTTATHTVTLTNNSTASLSIIANNGSAAIDGAISGNLTGSGTLTVGGTGTLALSGTNTSTGAIRVDGGVLRIDGANSLTTSARHILAGGVLGLGSGDYTSALGGGANQVVLLGDSAGSGFAAFGADRTVNIGSGVALSWASTSNFFTNANGGSADHLILNVAESSYKLTFQNNVNLNAAQRKITVGNGSASIDAAMTGVISGTGASALRKQGTGTLALTNANTYAGGTTIAEGTLLANNATGSATGSGAISLASGASLGGTGFVSGLVTTAGINSTFSPGSNSVGTLTLAGGIDATAGATFDFSLGSSSDLLNLSSATFTGSSVAGGLRFNFSDAGDLKAGVTYTLINFASASGLDFSDLDIGSIASGFVLDHFTINSTNLQVQFATALIPEPASFALLGGIAVLGLSVLRRRRS